MWISTRSCSGPRGRNTKRREFAGERSCARSQDPGKGVTAMPDNARKSFGDIAPALAQYTDDVLFGDVWERPGLKPRDRSVVTVACLIALYRTNELPFHLKKALENGL